MLLSLNEDCLIYLCKFLSLEDQVVLSRVCGFLKDFFENNFWKSQCKNIYLDDDFWYEAENKAYLPTFLRVAAQSVEKFTLKARHIEDYGRQLIQLKFPKMKTCVACLDEFSYGDQLPKVAQMFPNIKTLDAKGEYKGNHISLFKDLENLFLKPDGYCLPLEQYSEIYGLPNLKWISFSNYCGCSADFHEAIKIAHNCSTLERISFFEDVWSKRIMNSLKKIQNLRFIRVRTHGCFPEIWSNIKKIEKHFGEAIDSLVFYNIDISNVNSEKISGLGSLRSMILIDCLLEVDQFERFCCNLPVALEEFYYLYCIQDWEEEEEELSNKLIFLINSCLNLRVLDVSGSYVTENFVAAIANTLTQQKRKQPLLLRCFQTKVTQQNVKNLVLPEGLQVSILKGNYYCKQTKQYHVVLNRSKIKEEDVEEVEEEEVGEEVDKFFEEDYNYNISSRDVDFWSDCSD